MQVVLKLVSSAHTSRQVYVTGKMYAARPAPLKFRPLFHWKCIITVLLVCFLLLSLLFFLLFLCVVVFVVVFVCLFVSIWGFYLKQHASILHNIPFIHTHRKCFCGCLFLFCFFVINLVLLSVFLSLFLLVSIDGATKWYYVLAGFFVCVFLFLSVQ